MRPVLIGLGLLGIVGLALVVRSYQRSLKREFETSNESTPKSPPAEPAPMPTFTDVEAEDALDFIAEHPDLTLLDVRTPPECAGGIIEGALMIPMQSLQGREDELPDGPLLVYCAVGARSAAVADYLARSGRSDVYNLEGGMMGWSGPTVRP